MSQAHRPTWNPTMGRESKAGTQQVAKLALASHTKLKFRQPGQTTASDVARRDLRAELAAAERAAQDKKRKAAGLPPLASAGAIENGDANGEDEAAAKRRKVLEEAAELDRDDSDSEDEEEGDGAEEEGDDDSDSDSDDDDTAALMAELARIKAERAEEKARLEAEANEGAARDRDEEIATGNPLLNLQAALGQATTSSTSSAGFSVKRRWDDDLIFKNQAVTLDNPKKGEFVNDLLRSEFHKKFMQKFIK
ncbi:hypothetical protein CspeluHIS016_0802830 [Cutaneotrichosporon spelunceum]|uniref:Cwf15/Cwc15 cell cycle control protein n=1 Tax=Cutaneotrichosporon spelunceum TaxID=1672016 RepID=A0AAD3YF75_9TREE|nr:hypothetical protein CspeluHIS016_0802830 [Cutaneotrichosporon spelunceum]